MADREHQEWLKDEEMRKKRNQKRVVPSKKPKPTEDRKINPNDERDEETRIWWSS